MRPVDVAVYNSGPALVFYLTQPGATASVCDLASDDYHVEVVDEKMRHELVRGLIDGRVGGDLWSACAVAFLQHGPAQQATLLLDDVGQAYRTLIRSKTLESDPSMQSRLAVMQKLYVQRPNGIRSSEKLSELLSDLRTALAANRLGPIAARFGAELISVVDLEEGRWRGKRVDTALLDDLFTQRDEATLRLFIQRLPTEQLRIESRRRVLRLHIASSPFSEVRSDARAVEDRVMERGANVIDLSQHKLLSGFVERLPFDAVAVEQNLTAQTATVVGLQHTTLVRRLELRGALFARVDGISQPVTLCSSPGELDPTPCVSPKAVDVMGTLASVDASGGLLFNELRMNEAVGFTTLHNRLSVPVSIDSKAIATISWPFHFLRPANLIVRPLRGSIGPSLSVRVDHRDASRYIFEVTGGPMTYHAVVEAADAPAFIVASKGTAGARGRDGYNGMSGSSGSECSSGSSGSDGGPGGRGDDGGDGGSIDVTVDCGNNSCDEVLALLRRTIRSEGGEGGEGGRGGWGGSGGRGGSGRSERTHIDSAGHYIIDDHGCSSGSSGSSGSRGSDGSPGHPGNPGTVTFHVAGRRDH